LRRPLLYSFIAPIEQRFPEMGHCCRGPGRSSQVALHPPSRERSYHFRLQAGNVSLGRTSTFQIKRLHRRTSSQRPRRAGLLPDTGGKAEPLRLPHGSLPSCLGRESAHRRA
jgi:hypothetical protein